MDADPPEPGDALGAALLDHLESGDPGIHVFERDDGYVDVASAAVYFGGIEAWSPAEAEMARSARGRVLDVGAGAGRAALHLQEQGLEVTALDVSPGAVEVCRRRGVRATFLGTVGDLAATEPGSFDTLLLLGNNLGLVGSPEAAPEWLGTLRRLARPGARLIGTTRDPYRTEDPAHVAYHERNRRRGRMAGQVTSRTRYRSLATPWFDLLWVSLDELRAIVEPLGWVLRDVAEDGPLFTVVLETS
jgi:SAM-dependent methyltransferase